MGGALGFDDAGTYSWPRSTPDCISLLCNTASYTFLSFLRILFSRTNALSRVERFVENYQALPLLHRTMLPGMPRHIEALRSAIDINQQFVEKIVASAVGMFENSQVSQLVSHLSLHIHVNVHVLN